MINNTSNNLTFTAYSMNTLGTRKIAKSIDKFCSEMSASPEYEAESYKSIISDIDKLDTFIRFNGSKVFLIDKMKQRIYEIVDKKPKVSLIFNNLEFYVINEAGVKSKFKMKFNNHKEAVKESKYHTRAGKNPNRSILNRLCIAYSIGKYLDAAGSAVSKQL